MKNETSKTADASETTVLPPTSAHARKISTEEQQIVDFIDSHTDDAIILLEKIVNVESPTDNLAGVKQVGMLLRQEFEMLGFTADWLEMPVEMKRAGHLIAEKLGAKDKTRVLLLGHLDTVLSGERFRVDGTKAYGTGVLDMKAGNVIMYFALKALHATGTLKDANIIALFTGDEENAGNPKETSRREMIAAATRSDLALSFEFGVSRLAIVARRGSSKWHLEVAAKTGHSSQIFNEKMGDGAIFETARIINQFYEALRSEKYLTFNPSVIAGGTEIEITGEGAFAGGKANVVPAKAIAEGDLRFISEEQKENARAKMSEIVARNLPGTSAKITFSDGIPAMPPTDGNYALLEQLNKVSEDLCFGKIEAFDPGVRGAGDVSYVAHLIPGIDGLGAAGSGAHTRGEFADLETLPVQIKRAAVLIYRLTR